MMARALSSFAIGLALAGCIGASSVPSEAQQAANAAAVVRPAAPPAPRKPANVGAFHLDSAPAQGGISRGFVPAGTRRLVVDGKDVEFAPDDGRFVIGFDRDYAVLTTITAFLADGRAVNERLPVARGKWRIENLKTLPHHAQPDPEFQARRPGELAQIGAARRMKTGAQGWRQQFRWPALGRISGLFGSQRIYSGQPGSPHGGVDIAGGDRAPVYAPADGVVILAASSPFTLEGNLLMIDHGMGLNSSFLHLSKINVRKGDIIKQGQLIGNIGMTGRATGPHLHWGMRWFDQKLDAQPFAGPMPQRY